MQMETLWQQDAMLRFKLLVNSGSIGYKLKARVATDSGGIASISQDIYGEVVVGRNKYDNISIHKSAHTIAV